MKILGISKSVGLMWQEIIITELKSMQCETAHEADNPVTTNIVLFL
jgi:hypothetical protein